ncbi:MAP/microtubule affinity-regulating kinase 3 [Symbiodinium microadriaticum]|uniref:MAP/microtubule affinity-regulating kinase 3 n=1 Tax=Symbiodinium microadriaticum TaxID=2951 RepID=A0A1Q9EH64_SYMMI|nr:MAP/microtubule affinity-regulating kinase 3 [Symbiodinium microadriaticum]
MGRELEENYDLLEKIGRGSSGQVFRARRKADEKEVALKVMSATSPDVVASRRAEFEILSHLSHPNIVQGLDFFCSGSTAVIALSYHSGSTLSRAVRDSASSCLMEADSKRLFRKLISAVSYLHEHRIVHRDVKADNILVSSDLMDLHLVDFNTARPLLEGGALTMTGTTEYAAPEVLNGESPSEQHDVWGAGLCLHWMLMGALPQCASGYSTLRKFAAAVHAMPVTCQGSRWEAFSPECRDVLRRCLTISRHQRPAAMLVLHLPWVVEGLPVLKRRATSPTMTFDDAIELWATSTIPSLPELILYMERPDPPGVFLLVRATTRQDTTDHY